MGVGKNFRGLGLVLGLMLFGQLGLKAQVDAPIESVKEMLCKHWQIDYMLSEGVRVGRGSGSPNLIYAFEPDNSFVFTRDSPAEEVKGRWAFDAKNKWVRLIAKTGGRVVSLSEEEMVVVVDRKKPGEAGEMKMVFKVKKD
jgi:hypothetical protein